MSDDAENAMSDQRRSRRREGAEERVLAAMDEVVECMGENAASDVPRMFYERF